MGQSYVEGFLRHLAPTSRNPLLLEVQRAEGIFLYDPAGRAYYDLISGISVSNVGHANPLVAQAVRDQLGRHNHVMVYGEFVLAPQVMYAQMLAAALPPRLQTVYFTTSGSEAVEGALKLAKRLTGRYEIISFYGAYHGSTQGALSAVGDESLRRAFRPLIPGHRLLPFNDPDALVHIGEQTAAVLLELVQAESGVRPCTPTFVQQLRQRCTEVGALLVVDECQTAFGRCGTLFCIEQYSVVPDILILAKALGGGLPLGAFISSYQNMQALAEAPPLGHITTFGGHPLSCAAGMAAFRYLTDQGLVAAVAKKNKVFHSCLHHPYIRQIRSFGLLLAVELESAELCQQVIKACLQRSVVVDTFLFAPHCLRLAPPLIITEAQIEEACQKVLSALQSV